MISDTTDLSDVANTEFVGYTDLKSTSKVLAIVKDGVRVDSIGEGENAIIVLDKTPFYGEGGGQVGDTGVMESGSFSADVDNTTKNPSGTIYLHACTVKSGSINVGAEVSTAVDEERRADITRNHTAAHLLQSASVRFSATMFSRQVSLFQTITSVLTLLTLRLSQQRNSLRFRIL